MICELVVLAAVASGNHRILATYIQWVQIFGDRRFADCPGSVGRPAGLVDVDPPTTYWIVRYVSQCCNGFDDSFFAVGELDHWKHFDIGVGIVSNHTAPANHHAWAAKR